MEIAILADEVEKVDRIQFLNKNKDTFHLDKIKLIASGTTAENAGFKVMKMLCGLLGGDAQIAARFVEGKTKMILFLETYSLVTRTNLT